MVSPVNKFNLELYGFNMVTLILLRSERPKLYAILAFLSAIGLNFKNCAL